MKPIHVVMIYSPMIPALDFSTHQSATSPKDTEAPNFARRRAASVINKLPRPPPPALGWDPALPFFLPSNAIKQQLTDKVGLPTKSIHSLFFLIPNTLGCLRLEMRKSPTLLWSGETKIPEFNLVPKICNFSHMLQKSFMAAPQVVEVERYFNVFSLMSLGFSKFKVFRFNSFCSYKMRREI